MSDHDTVVPDRRLSHVDKRGKAMMVDVTGKEPTLRRAFTSTRVAGVHAAGTRFALGGAEAEILGTARLAGLRAAKATSELVPLCHPLPLTDLTVDFALGEDDIEVLASAETFGQTGVEMEALTACTLAAVCLLGYLAESDPGASIEDVRLLEKRGGRSGTWRFDDRDVTHTDNAPSDTSPPIEDQVGGDDEGVVT